jgi:hypothetical protein
VLDDAVELVEQGRARRARTLGERQERALPALGTGPLVAGIAREHEAVHDERALPGREQLRQAHVDRLAVRARAVEHVVHGDDAARRQLAPGSRHRFHRAPQLDLLLEQSIACRPVLGRFPWKGDAHSSSLRASIVYLPVKTARDRRIGRSRAGPWRMRRHGTVGESLAAA